MKKILLLVLLTFSTLSFGQETEFKFTKNGFTDFVVTSVEGKTQQELYKRTLDWIQVTYKNPKEVLLAQIENDYIRFEGIQRNSLCTKSLGMNICSNIRYQIEVSFKDGKYKFDVIKLETYTEPSKYTSGGWYEFPINSNDYNAYYKTNGEIKPMFKSYPESLEKTFNDLNKNLELFIKSETLNTKKSDW